MVAAAILALAILTLANSLAVAWLLQEVRPRPPRRRVQLPSSLLMTIGEPLPTAIRDATRTTRASGPGTAAVALLGCDDAAAHLARFSALVSFAAQTGLPAVIVPFGECGPPEFWVRRARGTGAILELATPVPRVEGASDLFALVEDGRVVGHCPMPSRDIEFEQLFGTYLRLARHGTAAAGGVGAMVSEGTS